MGDVITSLDGERIRSASELREKLLTKREKDKKEIKLGLLRNKAGTYLSVELPQQKDEEEHFFSTARNIGFPRRQKCPAHANGEPGLPFSGALFVLPCWKSCKFSGRIRVLRERPGHISNSRSVRCVVSVQSSSVVENERRGGGAAPSVSLLPNSDRGHGAFEQGGGAYPVLGSQRSICRTTLYVIRMHARQTSPAATPSSASLSSRATRSMRSVTSAAAAAKLPINFRVADHDRRHVRRPHQAFPGSGPVMQFNDATRLPG